MGWQVGWDPRYARDIGYGVPAICDHPDCDVEIDRGLSHVCCHEEPFGGEEGCGLFFCDKHLASGKCERCEKGELHFMPKRDTEQWTNHKMTDESWSEWRNQNGHPN